MLSQPICKQCKQPIWGNYIDALGATWHPEHFLCAACHKPILDSSFNMHEGMPYHPECYRQQVAPRCAYCGRPLMGEYLIDHWGTMFCKEHQGRYPTCAYCGRLVPPQQQEQSVASGESIRCPICRASAIETIDQARPLFSRLIQWVNSQGLVYSNLHLSLELVDRQKLGRLITGRPGTAGIHSQGVTLSTTHTLNGKVTNTEVNGIAVLEGMPALTFQGVTVHELGHVWLVVHDVKDLPLWAEEGFCELLAHRYYTQLNTEESRYHAQGIEKNPDSVYGAGFRRVRAIADNMGFQRFIETLQKTKKLLSL
ncbi:MAG: protein DA1 [Ktedonobacteraceae bacterium]